jgi:hypothetical protein
MPYQSIDGMVSDAHLIGFTEWPLRRSTLERDSCVRNEIVARTISIRYRSTGKRQPFYGRAFSEIKILVETLIWRNGSSQHFALMTLIITLHVMPLRVDDSFFD